jgi:hypothetical protein
MKRMPTIKEIGHVTTQKKMAQSDTRREEESMELKGK